MKYKENNKEIHSGDYIRYTLKNELGKIKRVADEERVFVWFHTGDTAASISSSLFEHVLSASQAEEMTNEEIVGYLESLSFSNDYAIELIIRKKEIIDDYSPKCDYCGESRNYMLTTIKGRDEKIVFCPYHLVEYADDIITIKPLEGRCECCNKKTSYEVTTHFGTYHLCYNHLIDFICHNLTYKSFFKLYKENIEGRCDFFLHSDFYWPKGYKSQSDEEYVRELKELNKTKK